MNKVGGMFVLFSLAVGILIGFGIEASKEYLATTLKEVMQEEAQKACGCSFNVDDVEVSFLSLSARASNPRLELNGIPALQFKKIKVSFGLSEIFSRQIGLELHLIDGHAKEVDSESPTFLFIDSLAAPLPPEKDRPDRWKLKLNSVRVSKGSFEQTVPVGMLTGTGASLEMVRDELDNFVLTPKLEKLNIEIDDENGSSRTNYTLGEVTGTLYLKDDTLDYQQLLLTLGRSVIKGSASMQTGNGQPVEGELNFSFFSDSLPIWSPVNGQIVGSAKLSKRASYPLFSGSFSNPPETPLALPYTQTQEISLPKVRGNLEIERTLNGTRVEISNLLATNSDITARSLTPLQLRGGMLSGSVAVAAKTIDIAGVRVNGVSGALQLKGTPGHPEMTSQLSIESAEAGGAILHSLEANISAARQRIGFTITKGAGSLETLRATGAAVVSPVPTLEETNIVLRGIPAGDLGGEQALKLSGELQVAGPLSPSGLKGRGALSIGTDEGSQLLTATVELERGRAKVSSAGLANSLQGSALVDLTGAQNSSLSISAQNLEVGSINPALECASTSATLDYSFPIKAPLTGAGALLIKDLELGCKPYQLKLPEPARIPISQGEFKISPFQIRSPNSSLGIEGTASLLRGPSIRAKGTLELAALIGFLPKVDTLSGLLRADALVSGNWGSPSFNGSIELQRGTFGVESVGLAADRINGSIEMGKDRISIKSLSGLINSGTFNMTGYAYPLDLGRSMLGLSFEHVTIEPQADASLTASGNIELNKGDSGSPRLQGAITLESGEIQQKFDLPSIIRILAESLLTRSRATMRTSALPNIELGVKISGSRNLFLLTNFAAGEFAADISIGGTLGKPAVSGEVRTLSGWVGLKNRRFEVTSGILSFNPAAIGPTIELLGETYLPSRTGEYTLVLLEVRGPLASPKFKLSSDQGLPESQLLALLTQSGTALRGTRASMVSDYFEDSSRGLLEDLTAIDLRRLWLGLTRIDSIAIEPVYNQLTGAIEPAIVAEKKLARRLNLRGESTFGGPGSVARAKVVYDLARSLAVEGRIETDPTRRVNPIETNLIYTILSRQPQYLEIQISGNNAFSSLDILEALRINESSRLLKSDLSRTEIALRSYLRDQGHLQAQASATCKAEKEYCTSLELKIDEGPASVARNIVSTGDPVPDYLKVELLRSRAGKVATVKLLEATKSAWISKLRSEGYIGARLYAEYQNTPNPEEVDIILDLSLGRPVTFIFEGNTAFSAEDFLGTINLFKRRQPFGNNTITILTQNMERLYREAGYLYASISYERQDSPDSQRITYLISIEEEQKTKVERVVVKGLESIPVEDLKTQLDKIDPLLRRDIFQPTAAVSEQLESHAKEIEAALRALGLPDASVGYEITPGPSGSAVIIEYSVSEGSPLLFQSVTVEGAPEGISIKKVSGTAISALEVNDYLEQVLSTIKEAGYLYPAAAIEVNELGNAATIEISAGARTTIQRIEVDGNKGIDTDTILRTIRVRPGEPWRSEKLDDSRRELLRLGLFSRVTLTPVDGVLDSSEEVLRVSVVERPLQTLEVGLGANSEYGLHLFGEASDRGIFADGRSLSFRFDTYWDSLTSEVTQGIADLRYTDPKVFRGRWTLSEDLRFQRLDLPTLPYNLDRLSFASYLTQANENGISTSVGHTIFEENLTDVDPGSILSDLDTGSVRLSLITGTISYDQRDNPLNPRSGFYGSFDYRLTSRALASDADFQAVSGGGSFVQPLAMIAPELYLAVNARAASAWTFGNTSDIPISQRYFIGGRTTVRGFKENSLGPKADDGSIIGGDMLILGNTELRYSLTESFAMHLFCDSGSVFLRGRDVSLGDLRYSSGVGLRYLSPIGPIGVDIGAPLDRVIGEDSYRIHFTIGNNF